MDNNGRLVKEIWWNGANGDERLVAPEGCRLVFVNRNYGDHDEDWVCLFDSAGTEIARHNARYIASITFGEG